jgi:signal transduction histidine kinase
MLKNSLSIIYYEWLATLGMLIGIYLTSLYSYLLFHTLAEIFTISVIVCIFIITWNTRKQIDNSFLIIIGTAFLFVGILDTLHLLSYKGIGVFQWDEPTNLPTQLWIATQYLLSLSFLTASLLISRKLNIPVTFFIYILITTLILLSIFFWRIFPQCYIEGTGLTLFKRVSEYIIAFIFLLSICVLYRTRNKYEVRIFRFLVAALIIMIVAEIAFADYISVYGFTNLIGHLLIVISFYLVYKAIIETGLKNPFSLLFRNLKNSEEGLEKRAQELNSLNTKLLEEMDERKKVEQELLDYEKNLEGIVEERTSQLKDSYQNLEIEINERKRAEDELRALSNRIIELQEAERHTIAQELHDEMGQLLTALNMLLNKVRRSADRANVEITILTDLDECKQVVKELLQQVRTLSVNLHPSMLDNIGIITTLEWYFEEYTKRTGIAIHFSHSGQEPKLSSRIRLTAYRIIQEALTNIARYANVKEATVQVSFNDSFMNISIIDQGKGFNLSDLSLTSSGLRGMRERAYALRGKCEVFSLPMEGTRIEVTLPLILEGECN